MGRRMAYGELDILARRESERCRLPTPGWRCNLKAGHDGPCPAWPDTLWLKLKWAWRMRSISTLFGRHVYLFGKHL